MINYVIMFPWFHDFFLPAGNTKPILILQIPFILLLVSRKSLALFDQEITEDPYKMKIN